MRLLLLSLALLTAQPAAAIRARDTGIAPGPMPTGLLNAITDVPGVLVGQITLDRGETIRTGVTAILPHGGNLFADKVPAGMVVANGFGKLMGLSQVRELGEIETPILLTNTLNVPEAAAAIIEHTLGQPGNEGVRSVNAVVGETNDGGLNDIRARAVTVADARRAIAEARPGPVVEGAVGAGRGTIAFRYKGGIGTASRRTPEGFTVGVIVQSNYGGRLILGGVPIPPPPAKTAARVSADGSIMIVVATDAPLSDRNLTRLAARAMAGLARTGSAFSNGSGDYAIAFSTAEAVRRTAARRATTTAYPEIGNEATTPLFIAAADATEEAIANSLLAAETVSSRDPATGETRQAVAVDPALVKRLLSRR
ncbi:P1 family peptidase [Sandarakinorhabdus sp. AAP62]|uniref:DmpA family aminopeptidase n=1 Tax=Sandarakinorhabdus sp. AAP62 TaxID=1248916 RepID=UPI0002FD4C35|nr:P1 family peptidase [Sandarakinorhabdus sp. AAP62]